MRAMILCAGYGERFRPVTERFPKPMLPVMGKPLLHYSLNRVRAAGIGGVVLNLHHLPDAIRSFAGDACGGMPICYSQEREILGPVGGIKKAEGFFGGETFIVVNGDIWFEQDLCEVAAFHREKGAGLTMMVMDGGDPALRAIGYDGAGRVRQVWGKPAVRAELETAVNIGIYAYEPYVLERYVEPDVFFDLSKDLMPRLFADDVPVFAFSANGYWADAGTPERYLELHRDLLAGRASLPPEDACPAEGGVSRRGDSRIAAGVGIHPPCFFGEGCEVDSGAEIGPYAVLGSGCRVGSGTRIENSVVFSGVVVKEGGSHVNEVLFESE